jgi:RNA polymerase sigma-70 factor (ECF subfamily)
MAEWRGGTRIVSEEDEELSFEPFFETEYGRLFRSLVLVSESRAEAEDLAQEAMARAWERWDRVRSTESPLGYVYRTAFNLNRRRLRRLRRSARIQEDFDPKDANGANPATIAETRHEIERALASLPISQRQALVLVEWVGMTAEEAGAVLGIAAASVRGRVFRAKSSLRNQAGVLIDE